MGTTGHNQKIIISFIFGILIGGGSMWVWLSDEQTMREKLTDTSPLEILTTNTLRNTVVVLDQISGLSIFIDEVSFEQDGWIAIHEDNDGVPGNILGAQLFTAGKHTSGVVDLLRGTMPRATYYAMLHFENGDRAFNTRNDTPLLGLDGQPIMTAFKTLP